MNDEKNVMFFYSTIIEFIEKGIRENRYFFNKIIFKGQKKDEIISEKMEDYIFDACMKFLSTSDGYKLYLHFMSPLYTDTSRIYIMKEIVRIATFSYFKDCFEKTRKFDINMDIRYLNISNCTISFLKKKLHITDDTVRFKDIVNINSNDFLDCNYRGGSSKKEIRDLLAFCNDIYSILLSDNSFCDDDCGERENILTKIRDLEERYSAVQSKKLELEQEEQDILDSIRELKSELFEFSSINGETKFQRKR